MSFTSKDLNSVQLEAVKSKNQHILILAGAGSGKTRTLTYRIAYLIHEKNVDPSNILAVTFTNKAAREMKERVEKLAKGNLAKLWIGTFHSMFARLLRMEAKALPYGSDFTIYDSDDQVNAIKKVMSMLNIPQQLHSPKLFQARISQAKNKMISPDKLEVKKDDNFDVLLPDVFRRYNEFLHENNAVDFDDLLLLPMQLFNDHPSILKKYHRKFKYILVDEYQDTNKAQYSLIHQLMSKNSHICVVGDEDQSIYRWRGADINNILNFNKDYPEAKVFRLEENYRSNKYILNGAGALISNNTERLGKDLWTNRKDGDPIILMDAENESDEAKKIVENIHKEMFSKKRSFKDIAILYRTNAQSRALEDELRKNAISYAIVSGVKFYERKEIKDILAYLKVITNPRDSVSLRRIVNFPLRGIGETTVGKIEKFAEALNISLLEGMGKVQEVISISSGMANRVLEFYEMINKYQKSSKKISAAELTSSLTHETGIITHLKNEYDQYESESRIDNVYELFSTIEIFSTEREQEKKDSSLSAFLEDVALLSDIDSMNTTRNSVTMMTLHSSKGLEFPVIFITGMEMGLFPLQRNFADNSELEEERRLLYVGMTRAQENLYLSYARSRRRFNNINYTTPSLFLDEIPSEFTEERLAGSSATGKGKSKRHTRRKKLLEYFHQEDESQEEVTSYAIGSRVYHETFGKGEVIGVEGQGDKMKISIKFEGEVYKKLIAQYANLTPLEISD
jgi:DNA helicase-2/ATP-dependent DNA helicase PcrA